MGSQHTIQGQVVSPPDGPVGGVEVQVVDADPSVDDFLGTDRTDGDGEYAVTVDLDDAGGASEGDPEIYLRFRRGGETLHEQAVTLASGSETTVDPVTVSVGSGSGTTSMPHHGMVEHRGMSNVPRDPAHPGQGRFGRMFPHLAAADHDVEFLKELGLPGGYLDEGDQPVEEAESVPAGFVFLGQFIDHDITLDPLSSLARQNDPDALRNYRTPRLDLDNVYGSGPEVDRFLYQSPFGQGPHTGDGEKLLLGLNADGEPDDVPRTRDDTAIIADMRNDENLIVSQLQHVMLKFHNRIVDWLDDDAGFHEAQKLARWHFQWVVLHDYLPTVCQPHIVEDVLEDGRQYYEVALDDEAYIPVEFAGAAYRFGHSQAREKYEINDEFGEGTLFARPGSGEKTLGRGFQPVPPEKVVDWHNLFDIDSDPQPARGIDPKLPPDLLDLPFVDETRPPFERSLASRNLVRGRRLGLPSGQAVARAMGVDPLDNDDIGFDEALARHGQPANTEAPLWYYVLGEAREQTGGTRLGTVGSRIVAEVLIGLIASDPGSFMTVQPAWEPDLPDHYSDGEFGMADLVAFALDY
ncbi:peroxidase family protein [Halorientalis pallida]|uniref:peroxidase family protein n=1 Tax=Halorientalis pallida TaxID=2479928 RepID=UPI003C6F27AC